MAKTIIIGAGVGGLTLAHRLSKKYEVLVLEAGTEPGGVITSIKEDGYLLELGANSTLTTPEFNTLNEELGITNELVTPPETSKNRYIVSQRNKLTSVPMSPLAALTSPLLTTSEKLKVLKEPFIARSSLVDESIADFVSRRFGPGVAEKIVAPALSGIWAGDISKLSSRSALKKLWQLECDYGSVIKGMFKKPKSQKQKKIITSYKNGMQELPRALASSLKDRIHYNTSAKSININKHVEIITEKESFTANHLILATPATTTAHLISSIDKALSQEITTIPYAGLTVFHFGFPKDVIKHPLNGFGALVQPRLNMSLLGILFSSSMFPSRAPKNHTLLTCFSKTDNPEIITKEISELLDISQPPTFTKQTTWPAAIPNYPLGHFALQQQVEEFHRTNPQITLFGNWLSGISVADRISEAEELSAKLSAFI